MGEGLLSGLRVVEISAFIAAPLGGATLAALGADVVRVEPPGGGIDIGRWPIYNGRSLYRAGLDQGKRSVTIDMRTETGQAQVAELITAPGEGGGILLTNLPLGGWNSYSALSKKRADLVMVVITGSRDGGTAVDYTVNAAVGFPMVTGSEDDQGPVNHVLPAWDCMTGYLAAMAIVAADRHRLLTGKGQLVELSLADVALATAGHLGLIGEASLDPQPRARFGNNVYGTFGRDFKTRDGHHVMVLALTPRQWRSLSEATGLSQEFAALQKGRGLDFQQDGDRWRARVEICALLESWVETRDLSNIKAVFDDAGVLWGPYQTFKDLIAEGGPTRANPMFAELNHPGLGRYPTTSSPVRFGAVDAVPPKPAPSLGQHTSEVLRELGRDQ